ncbi:MAG TPA: ATP-binding protein, partial [Spirochaetia bacterium]|nr:ATP-binding protein [Spirochaetia bacterium]
ALLDRIDMRVPLAPVPAQQMCMPTQAASASLARERVAAAIRIQRERYAGLPFSVNSRIPPGLIDRFCPLRPECASELARAAEIHAISSRAFHSVLRIARTIADLEAQRDITSRHLTEAIQHRRYGDCDYFWTRVRP